MGVWDQYALHQITLGNPMKEASLLNMQQYIKLLSNANYPLFDGVTLCQNGQIL